MQMDFKNAVLTVIFTASVFILWQNWEHYNNPQPVAGPATTTAPATSTSAPVVAPEASAPVATAPVTTPAVQGEGMADYSRFARVSVKTDLVQAEVSALGGDLVHLELLKHHVTGDTTKNFVILDEGKQHRYVARSDVSLPGLPARLEYKLPAAPVVLADGQDSVTLKLDAAPVNGVAVSKLLTFHRGSYLIDVRYEVVNQGAAPLTGEVKFELARDGKPVESHTGPMAGVSTFTGPARYTEEKKFEKVKFSDIDENKDDAKDRMVKDGWVAMVQHYFISAFVPKGDAERVFFTKKLAQDFYASGVRLGLAVPAGQTAKLDMPLYVGPSEQSKLKEIAPGLDLVVDYGWVTMIAVPLFMLLSFIHKLFGNWGWSIIALTVLIKAAFFPLSAASYRSMAKMKTLMPKMKALQERYASDKMKLNQEMMNLYKKEKVNPMGGCLPILVQIPVFMALYYTLLSAVEMRAAPWLGWIQDLSAMDPYYVLPVIMAISMFVQTKLNPTPPDPIQAKVMLAMPLIFGVMFLWMPSGLVLYWVVNNILSITQQWYITRSIEGGNKK